MVFGWGDGKAKQLTGIFAVRTCLEEGYLGKHIQNLTLLVGSGTQSFQRRWTSGLLDPDERCYALSRQRRGRSYYSNHRSDVINTDILQEVEPLRSATLGSKHNHIPNSGQAVLELRVVLSGTETRPEPNACISG